MSKKKNTLKDLDEFLKQQATTLVPPSPLIEKTEEPQPAPPPQPVIVQAPPVIEVPQSAPPPQPIAPPEISIKKVLEDLSTLSEQDAKKFRKDFYELIITHLESKNQSLPEDKMLINTALYLKSGDNWKEVIRNYWRNKGG